MKNDQPNAAQKRWREEVRALGSIISGGPAVIHHCAGRTASHNKRHIGHWWILPLTDDEHKEIHALPNRKEREKELFEKTCIEWVRVEMEGRDPAEGWSPEFPFDNDVLTAIMDYHR